MSLLLDIGFSLLNVDVTLPIPGVTEVTVESMFGGFIVAVNIPV